MKIKLISFLLLLTFPAISFAEGKVASIKQGQRAPYDGFLLDHDAYATIEATKQSLVQKCEADLQHAQEKCETQNKFIVDTHNNEKEVLERNFDIQLQAKNSEIERLTKKVLEPKPSRGLWFALGAGTAIVIGAGVAIGVAKAL